MHVEQKRTLVRAFLEHWPITEVDLHSDHVLEHVLEHVYVKIKLPNDNDSQDSNIC